MAAIKASVNLFSLLDGNDPGDNRLVDLDSQLNDQPRKNLTPAGAAAMARATNKQTAPGFNKSSEKSSPALAAGHNVPRKNLTPAGAAAMARAVNKQTAPAPPAPPATGNNLTGVLFAYPSARERIFKQRQEELQRRQEEFQRQQADAMEKGGSVSGDDGKGADAGAPADKTKWTGKTHGVKVQQGGAGHYYNAAKQPAVAVKEASAARPVKEPAMVSVVKTAPSAPAPPSIDDIAQFPSLSLK